VHTRPDNAASDKDHGPHTLRVWRGTVVGVYGNDVFVDLAPRMQGVISRRAFDEPPREGEAFDFTLRGQEEGLWVLSRVDERPLASWDEMEEGSVVQARVTGRNDGGLELKIGPLHAFMPRSQTGLARGTDPKVLVGKTLPCEVMEVDPERQRVLVSRKALLDRERLDERKRAVHSLKIGQVVRGRVTRIEEYGAFVAFGQGLEGLVHISNLSLDPVAHPSEVVRKGEQVEAKVLSIRQEGRRIGLGLKQMEESPWKGLERSHYEGQILEGVVTRTTDFGAFVAVARGVEGLVHNREAGLPPGRRLRDVVRRGQPLTVRLLSFDVERERMSLSQLHADGSRIRAEEAAGIEALRERRLGDDGAREGTNLGQLLEQVLGQGGPARRPAGPEPS
jgi:small subunit ribosomal protein S1